MVGFRKRILFIGSDGVVLFAPSSGGGVEREAAIAWSVPNFSQQLILALKRGQASKPVLIMFDSPDKAFRKEENIPKLSGGDRQKYVKRKLDQVFSAYPVRAFLEMKDSEKTKDKKSPPYLFVAITETEHIDKVVDCILEAAVPVVGLGVLPIESEGLVAALADKVFGKGAKKSKWAVLIGQHEAGGLSQIIVKNGKMVLARLTPVSDAGVEGAAWAQEVINEFNATQTYLTRLGYRQGEGLDVMLIASDSDRLLFAKSGFAPGDNFMCMTAANALERLGYRKNILSNTNFGDALYAAWGSNKRFLTLALKIPSLMNIFWPRFAARMASVALAVFILGALVYNFTIYQNYLEVQETIGQKQSQKALLEKEYAQESKVFGAFPVKLDVVQNTLAVTDQLNSKVFKVTPFLNMLRNSLPMDIKLSNLKVEFTPNDEKKGLLAKAKPKDDKASKSGGDIAVEFQFSLLKDMPLEQKVTRAEQIVEIIKQTFVGYEVKLNSQFGNASREGGFSGSTEPQPAIGKDGVKPEDLASISITGAAP